MKKQPGFVASKLVDSAWSAWSVYLLSLDLKSKIMSTSYVQNYIFNQAKGKVMSQTQGLYPAPLRILDVRLSFCIARTKVDPICSLGHQTNGWKWLQSGLQCRSWCQLRGSSSVDQQRISFTRVSLISVWRLSPRLWSVSFTDARNVRRTDMANPNVKWSELDLLRVVSDIERIIRM